MTSLGGGDRDKAVQAMIEQTVKEMYRDDEANQFLEVTYQNGDKEIMYFKDFSSGAMIENIVRRAKKLAIKRLIGDGSRGIRVHDLIESIHQEYKEHEDLPNTTNPDDWAKISGKKGERIIYVRTLIKRDDAEADRRSVDRAGRHRPVPVVRWSREPPHRGVSRDHPARARRQTNGHPHPPSPPRAAAGDARRSWCSCWSRSPS